MLLFLLQILQPREHLLYERHPAVALQPALVLHRPVEAGHPVEEGPRQRPPEVRPAEAFTHKSTTHLHNPRNSLKK